MKAPSQEGAMIRVEAFAFGAAIEGVKIAAFVGGGGHELVGTQKDTKCGFRQKVEKFGMADVTCNESRLDRIISKDVVASSTYPKQHHDH